MTRLFFIILTLASTTLAGIGVIAALSMNMFDVKSILVAAALGAVISLPASWVIARKIEEA